MFAVLHGAYPVQWLLDPSLIVVGQVGVLLQCLLGGFGSVFPPLTLTKSTARRRTDIHENSNSAYCFCEIWIAPEWATRHSQWEYSGSVDLRIEIAMLEDVAVLHLSQFCRENLQWYYKFEPALHTSKRMHFIEDLWLGILLLVESYPCIRQNVCTSLRIF